MQPHRRRNPWGQRHSLTLPEALNRQGPGRSFRPVRSGPLLSGSPPRPRGRTLRFFRTAIAREPPLFLLCVKAVVAIADALNLREVLESRGDPMDALRSDWLEDLREVPEDSAAPLAMSGPHPDAVGSYGWDCLGWLKAQGQMRKPRWWQALAIVRQFEHDAFGRLVWRELIESGPRRIGKSTRLRGSALWRVSHPDVFGEDQLAMLVSKDLAIGREIHARAWPWATSLGWNVVRNLTQTEVGNDRGRWLLRSHDAVYGYDVGYGQVDESWDVKPAAIEDGLEPAMLERESPQLHLTSTAHVKASSLMRGRITDAILGLHADTLLLLWGATPDADFGDPAVRRAASPHWSADRQALVERTYLAAMSGVSEFDDPDPIRGWAAQYLNVWPMLFGDSVSKVLPRWGELSAPVRSGTPSGLGVAADPDGTWLSFGAAIPGDKPHLALLSRMPVSKRRAFVDEVVRVWEKYRIPVVLDKGGPASFLIPDFERAGVALELVGSDQYVQAVADIVQAVASAEIEHGGYPDLDAATVAADWRYLLERRVFARRSGDISALEAVTLALHWAKAHEVKNWMSTFG